MRDVKGYLLDDNYLDDSYLGDGYLLYHLGDAY